MGSLSRHFRGKYRHRHLPQRSGTDMSVSRVSSKTGEEKHAVEVIGNDSYVVLFFLKYKDTSFRPSFFIFLNILFYDLY